MDLSVADMKKAISGKLLTKTKYNPITMNLHIETIDIDDLCQHNNGRYGLVHVEDWIAKFRKWEAIVTELSCANPESDVYHEVFIEADYDYDNTSYILKFVVRREETEEERIARVYQWEQEIKEQRAKKAAKKAADKKVDVELELDALIIRATKDKKLRAKLVEKLGQLPQ